MQDQQTGSHMNVRHLFVITVFFTMGFTPYVVFHYVYYKVPIIITCSISVWGRDLLVWWSLHKLAGGEFSLIAIGAQYQPRDGLMCGNKSAETQLKPVLSKYDG